MNEPNDHTIDTETESAESLSETPAAPAAAEAANALFAAVCPDAAAVAAPFVVRLFQAQADGHAFVWTNQKEREQLSGYLPLVGGSGGDAPLVLDGRRLFFRRVWQLERDLAGEIRRLSSARVPQPSDDTLRRLHEWFDDAGSRDQQAAAALTLHSSFTLISGGPGTGKTTTVAKLLALLCGSAAVAPRIALAAPTGKAAARMTEALHRAASAIPNLPDSVRQKLASLEGRTVHRLLGLRPPQMRPQYGAARPLDTQVLVLDEASMLDSCLLWQLLCALETGCRVILLGDGNQLPSVGAGAVLPSLTAAPPLPPEESAALHRLLPPDSRPEWGRGWVRLRQSHRFGADSAVGALAQAVASGDAAAAVAAFARFPKQLARHERQPENAARTLYRAQADYWRAVDSGDAAAAFAQQSGIVVLTALRGDAQAFNQTYRRLLQRHGRPTDARWFAGQILMVSRNDTAQGLYNGDIGIVLPAAPAQQQADENGNGSTEALAVWFADGRGGYRSIPPGRLPAHEDAFAITVHKSQGSEYREVWLLDAADTVCVASRALLYTALTRARESFAYWGSLERFEAACKRQEIRRSALAGFLRQIKAA